MAKISGQQFPFFFQSNTASQTRTFIHTSPQAANQPARSTHTGSFYAHIGYIIVSAAANVSYTRSMLLQFVKQGRNEAIPI